MNGLFKNLPKIKDVHTERVKLDQPFEIVAARFANDAGTVLLLSGLDLDCSRYHILGVAPWLEIKGKGHEIQVKLFDRTYHIKEDPFSFVDTLLDHFKMDRLDSGLPFCTGLLGYFAYDLKDRIEILPRTCLDTGMPDICLYAPSIILVHDKWENITTFCTPMIEYHPSQTKTLPSIHDMRDAFLEKISIDEKIGSFSIDNAGFRSSFRKEEYIRSVEKIIAYLKAGDIYQANLSQRFEIGFKGDSYALFLDLFQRNPASFFSFINAGDHSVVSTSPERFIKQEGKNVETRPIKGTIARGSSPEADEANSLELSQSIKDDAELTMIVDLMRNDLSRVTKHGSVIVKEHKRIEPYENVFHLVSIVEGELCEDKNAVDLLRATFPGGSITGCPKIRSMEIIDELEPVKRHVYTGSIGFISFHETMDLSIAIRTATLVDDTIFFSVGGGIVYDSDPEKEFQETLDKGKTLMESLSNASVKNQNSRKKAWVDGKMVDEENALIPVLSTGFQYGAGLFETIKVEKGHIFRLEDHVARFNTSWEYLFDSPPPDITWRRVIDILIRENDFAKDTLAFKIMAARNEQKSGDKIFLAAFAKKYVHRLLQIEKGGLDLVTYPFARQSDLADHKTLNYFFYHHAGAFAKKHRAHEAVILNPDHSVSETNTCNIIIISGKKVILPASDHVLSGVTQKAMLKILSNKGYVIEKQKISKQDLSCFANIMVSNSLMGAVRVLSVDGKSIDHEVDLCDEINRKLFSTQGKLEHESKSL
ncbi:MAG: aminodeoxychorismate synthase component I [Desulfobacteraceae bacterium]|nr:aminodeoxychorismate synthase component I [Desulfobacteraceae bacterium]